MKIENPTHMDYDKVHKLIEYATEENKKIRLVLKPQDSAVLITEDMIRIERHRWMEVFFDEIASIETVEDTKSP